MRDASANYSTLYGQDVLLVIALVEPAPGRRAQDKLCTTVAAADGADDAVKLCQFKFWAQVTTTTDDDDEVGWRCRAEWNRDLCIALCSRDAERMRCAGKENHHQPATGEQSVKIIYNNIALE